MNHVVMGFYESYLKNGVRNWFVEGGHVYFEWPDMDILSDRSYFTNTFLFPYFLDRR